MTRLPPRASEDRHPSHSGTPRGPSFVVHPARFKPALVMQQSRGSYSEDPIVLQRSLYDKMSSRIACVDSRLLEGLTYGQINLATVSTERGIFDLTLKLYGVLTGVSSRLRLPLESDFQSAIVYRAFV